MKKLLNGVAVLSLLTSMSFASVASAAPTSAGTPDFASNPVLASIGQMGAKFYYLGNRAGLDGWFIVKGGQVQVAYATPDNRNALIGALFGANGENITAVQVAALVQNNKDVADLIAAAQKEQASIASVGSQPSTTPSSTPAKPAMLSTPLSPGERLIHDLSGASTIVVGNPASPEILMVMDPECPHCKLTWKSIRSFVMDGTVHLRMIPIANQGGDNEREAAVLLSSSDALHVWDNYVMNSPSALAGTPTDAAIAAVRANHVIIDQWNIQNTPYLVYRGKDGKVKIVQGEPEKVSTILTDIGR